MCQQAAHCPPDHREPNSGVRDWHQDESHGPNQEKRGTVEMDTSIVLYM